MNYSVSLRNALPHHVSGADLDEAQAKFETAYNAGKSRWPMLSVSPDAFVEFVLRRLPPGDSWSDRLLALHLEDLYLACSCVRPADSAVAAFTREFAPKIDGIFRDAPLADVSAKDFRDRVASHILVGESGNAPRISKYGGRGALRYWVGVVASRFLTDLARARSPDGPAPLEQLAALPAPDDTPEAAYLRHYYREQFEEAIKQAFEDLEPKDRELLRFHVIDQMPTTTIAAVFDIHRGTAARWLKEARQKLLWLTRDRLVDRFQIPRGELESILRLVQSQVELSVRRLLQPEP